MTTEAIDTLREHQRDALLAQAAAAEAERRATLWQMPVIADADVPLALDVPPSLWNQQKTIGDTPPLFTIGRRVFVRISDLRQWLDANSDLRQWLDAKAEAGAPGSRRLRKLAASEAAA